MTVRVILACCWSVVLVSSGCTLVDDAQVPVDFSIDGLYDVLPNQSGFWSAETNPININDLLENRSPDKVKDFRIYDIRIGIKGPYPSGQVSGTVAFSFDGSPTFTPILSFEGLYSEFAEGVSLVRRNNVITTSGTGLQSFLNALNNPNGRPTSIVLKTSGTTVTPVSNGVIVAVEIFAQADTDVF
ncbi:MAG TPA: hypothetical protein VGB89_02730 [Bacteroidota bacterium]